MKKTISVILCILMISLLPTAAWADTASEAAQTAANTAALKSGSIDSGNAVPVSANLSATQLSFEISETITAKTQTADDPTILTYSSLTIENKMQTGALQVDRISATAAGDYTLTAEPTDSDTYWKGLAVDSKQFSMRISCSSTPTVNNHDLASSSLTKRPTINTGKSITYTFNGHTGISSTAFNGKIAQLVVTVSLKVVEPTPALKLSTATASGLSFKIETANAKWQGTLETSIDGKTWQTYYAGTTVTADVDKNVIYIRGKGNTVISGSNATGGIVVTGTNVSVSGDLNALLDYEKLSDATMGNSAFMALFADNTAITDASGLILERDTVKSEGYKQMFYSCTKLVNGPATLDVVTVEASGCEQMFCYCSKLKETPTLPAKYVGREAYHEMFRYCNTITRAPELPATDTSDKNLYDSYWSMFRDCKSLKYAPSVLPAKRVPWKCYQHMFRGCSNLETLPKIEAERFDGYACQYMFYQCSKIKLSATKTGAYTNGYKIGTSSAYLYSGEGHEDHLLQMFAGTSGTFKSTPDITTTYYTSNTVG